jgi:gamma-glutamyltranspeptidase/glutathione hydrolase
MRDVEAMIWSELEDHPGGTIPDRTTWSDVSMSVRGVVASGHPATTEAAATVLRAGGNAFDAAVAAGFAAAVAEPCLTSPGGGGFLMARTAAGDVTLLDFFVAVPGLGAPTPHDPARLEAVTVRFHHADQVFHVGPASVATPGCLAGFVHVHDRLGRIELAEVVAPAVDLARGGVVVDRSSASVFELLATTLMRTPTGRELFFDGESPLCEGAVFRNERLGQFLHEVGHGRRRLDPATLGGGVTATDLDAYRVVERPPLVVPYREAVVLTNPLPSLGGTLVASALRVLGSRPAAPRGTQPEVDALVAALVAQYDERQRLGAASTSGTTHVSVEDAFGNVAAMTTSNGSCSGVFAGDTGVQLNNMMGEEDLHPGGFGTLPAGSRIGSMMAPTLVDRGSSGITALGTGGSERIRSALTQVIVGLVDHGVGLADAVEAPRVHWDGTTLQVEQGFDVDLLRPEWRPNVWASRDLYFGGVHSVHAGRDAVGDQRRGGAALVVED